MTMEQTAENDATVAITFTIKCRGDEAVQQFLDDADMRAGDTNLNASRGYVVKSIDARVIPPGDACRVCGRDIPTTPTCGAMAHTLSTRVIPPGEGTQS